MRVVLVVFLSVLTLSSCKNSTEKYSEALEDNKVEEKISSENIQEIEDIVSETPVVSNSEVQQKVAKYKELANQMYFNFKVGDKAKLSELTLLSVHIQKELFDASKSLNDTERASVLDFVQNTTEKLFEL